jgi:hypothetical protein
MKKIHLLFTVGQLFYYIYCSLKKHLFDKQTPNSNAHLVFQTEFRNIISPNVNVLQHSIFVYCLQCTVPESWKSSLVAPLWSLQDHFQPINQMF